MLKSNSFLPLIETINMNRVWLFAILLMINTSCRKNSKWEEIDGEDIKFDTPEAIYFEDLNNGLIGSYVLEEDPKSENYDHLETTPVLYHTKDGGKEWTLLKFEKNIKGGIKDVFLSKDTIFCKIDYNPSVIYKSTNLGIAWNKLNSSESKIVEKKLFNKDRYNIKKHDFEFKNEKYSIKEKYDFGKTTVIICYGKESLTDYFFVSHDHEQNWSFLQEDRGSNKQKFLYKDLYLLSYESHLQRLKLK